ncbi:UNVERIFIED_CONTAM: hypothetical protein GTU68_002844 [Idotea baltica]|nr:hypothetical protein [Idotea baltica]
MWSEHCSYKNSIIWLKTLPKDGDKMLVSAGEENAGLVDIGDGLACAFKIESHNHPSALEPYQGAATGVGGIHRDIFTMGARPIAALNSLRFGKLTEKRTQHLLKGVVSGIGDYGNSFGVPTVGGEVYFDECYHTNPLVNAMSAGIVKVGETVSATSYGVGNPVFIVGSATGKDGIAGAAFASKDISADSMDDLPAVQVGDPFQEKLLLEASLEVIATGAVIGMQDMGAAGITCSTSEMSAKGEHGMKVYLHKVPMRQNNMKDWEILLSESQERMLIVVEKGKENLVQAVFDKWDLNCVEIGEVIAGDHLEYYMEDELVAKVPYQSLVLEPPYYEQFKKFNIDDVAEPKDLKSIAEQLVKLPNIASKKWVAEQYDSMVGIANMSTNKPSDAALVRVIGTNKALALTVDCNSRYIKADPKLGCALAVAEAARNIVCSGGEPQAITNCLNFGNPYNPHVYWQFVNAIKGMSEACLKFDTPVTGGNVSFYNQSSDDGPVNPTPTIGMLGLLEDISNQMTLDFKNEGDTIYLIGEAQNDISSSEYLFNLLGIKESPIPHFNLEEEYTLQEIVKALIKGDLIESAHDVTEGGLFIAMLESAMVNELGFTLATDENFRKDAYLFGESASRIVVSVSEENRTNFDQFMAKAGFPFSKIGNVTDSDILVNDESWGDVIDWEEAYNTVIHNALMA